MKKYILSAFAFITLCALIPMQIWAGNINEISADQTTHEGEYRSSLSITMDTDAKALQKAWSKFMRKNHGVKLSGKTFMSAEKVNVSAVSDRTLDFYTQLEEENGTVTMQVFGRYGYDVYMAPSTDNEDFQNMRVLLSAFVESYLPVLYMEKIEAQEKIVEEISDEKEDFHKDFNDVQEDIASNEEDIKELKSENEELAMDAKNIEELTRIQSVKLAEEEKKLERLKAILENAKTK